MKAFLLALLLAGLIPNAFADVNEKPVAADTSDKFEALAAAIRIQMDTGGRYEFISITDRASTNADLDRMSALLKKSGSVAEMKDQDRVQLFNLQEHINGTLTHNDNERLLCKREAAVGSHITTTTCRTYGEIQREKLALKDYTERNLHNNPGSRVENCPFGGRFANKCTIATEGKEH